MNNAYEASNKVPDQHIPFVLKFEARVTALAAETKDLASTNASTANGDNDEPMLPVNLRPESDSPPDQRFAPERPADHSRRYTFSVKIRDGKMDTVKQWASTLHLCRLENAIGQ